jgi:hypothetical protein
MQPIVDFLNNPLVAPIYALLVVAFADFLLGLYRSIQQGAFDWAKLPAILDSTVVALVFPLALLGVASFFVTDPTAKTGLQTAYVAGSVAALASAVVGLVKKIAGAYVATRADGTAGAPRS